MPFAKYWRSAAGAALLLRGPLVWLLDWGGRIEFAANHAGDLPVNYLLNPPAWANYALILAGLALIWWDTRRARALPYQTSRRMIAVDPYLVLAAVAAVVMVVAFAAYVARRQAEPIEWKFNLLGSPITAVYVEGEPLRIAGFSIAGRNKSGHEIDPIEAYIKSRASISKIDLGIVIDGKIISLSKSTISAGADFSLAYSFPLSNTQAVPSLSPEQFRLQYGSFDFHFRAEGYEYDRKLDKKEVDDIVDRVGHDLRELWDRAKQMRQGGVIEKP